MTIAHPLTKAVSFLSVLKCMRQISDAHIHGQKISWFSTTGPTAGIHQLVLSYFNLYGSALSEMKGLDSIASSKYQIIDDFCKHYGFNNRIQSREGLFFASYVDLQLLCAEPSTPTVIAAFGTTYSSFALYSGVSISHFDRASEPLVQYQSSLGYTVNIMVARDAPVDELDLFLRAHSAMEYVRGKIVSPCNYSVVVIPTSIVNVEPDISWTADLLAGRSRSHSVAVQDPFQKFQLVLDGQSTGYPRYFSKNAPYNKDILAIDKPFYLWITYPGFPMPVACAYIAQDCWVRG